MADWQIVPQEWLSRKKEERPSSTVELEAIFLALSIQDHLCEMALRLFHINEWAKLDSEERIKREAVARHQMEEKNVLFALPKEESKSAIRQKLGLDDATRVHSYGDALEKKSLLQVDELQTRMEKDLRALARKARAKAEKLARDIDRGILENVHAGMAQHEGYLRIYENVSMTFEAIAGRKMELD
jgi:hypothetical protein